jgi:DNA-binding transcriptional LysR family regulator
MVEDFGTTALPFILSRLRREHPHFELTVETGLGVDLIQRLEAGSLNLILTKRVAGRNQAASLCRQNLDWVGQPGVFQAGNDFVPLALYPAPAASCEIILRTLREKELRWSIRFESASSASLRGAVLAGVALLLVLAWPRRSGFRVGPWNGLKSYPHGWTALVSMPFRRTQSPS